MQKSKHLVSRIVALAFAVVLALGLIQTAPVDTYAKTKSKVNSVTVTNLPAKQLTLKKGGSKQLKVKVSTTGKASKKVSYKSSNGSVVSVSGKGLVKAKKKGKAKITVASKKSKKVKTVIKVTVGTPVKSVKLNKKKATINAGEKLKLKTKVKTKKASNKKIVWSTSDKKVATVKKGTVKGVAGGKATITAEAKDGSGKKAKCKVTVANKISSVNVASSHTIQVKLAGAQALSESNFTVKSKSATGDSYNHTCEIYSITSSDNKTYQISLKYDEELSNKDKVQVTVKGLKNAKTSSAEATYTKTKLANTNDYIYRDTKGESVSRSLSPSTASNGYASFSVSGLPSGISYEVDDNSIDFYGKPTATGTFTTTVVATDELGNTDTYTITWLIGSDTAVQAAYSPIYSMRTDGEVYVSASLYKTGGTSPYTYAISGNSNGLTIDEDDGYLHGYISAAGMYTVNVKVTDANGKSATAKLTINIKQALKVEGTLKDAQGKALDDYQVRFKREALSRYSSTSSNVYTDDDGKYTVYLESGTYDIHAEYSYGDIEAEVNKYQQSIKSATTMNLSLPIYKITVTGDDDVSYGTWYNSKEKSVGRGSSFYLPAGTYSLHTSNSTYTISLTVPNTTTVKAVKN